MKKIKILQQIQKLITLESYSCISNCLLGMSNAEIVNHILVNDDDILILFIAEEWEPRNIVKIWDWKSMEYEYSIHSIKSFYEWCAIIKINE